MTVSVFSTKRYWPIFSQPTNSDSVLVILSVRCNKRQKFCIGTSFFLNITTVIDNIIIKKGINYLLSNRKSTAKSVYYLHLRSVNDRATFPETDTEVPILNFSATKSRAGGNGDGGGGVGGGGSQQRTPPAGRCSILADGADVAFTDTGS